MRRVLLSVLVVLSLCFAGCTSSASVDAPQDSFATQFQRSIVGDLNSEEEAEVQATVFREIQNGLADCMKAEGFDFTPETDPNRFSTPARLFFTKDDVEAHGFGIVAQWRDADASDSISINDDYVASLDAENRSAYFLAFEGPEGAPPPSGCTATAQQVAFDRLGIADLAAALPAALGQVGEDPRIAAADSEWRSCIRQLGIATDASSLPEYVAGLAASFADGPAVTNDPGQIEEFQRHEIALAAQTLDCNTARNDVVVKVTASALTAVVDPETS